MPLTSGRSGLASAVIYQPSCPQNYTQECTIAQNHTKREYDDNSGVPPPNDGSSSMNLNYTSNVYSNLRDSGGGSGNRDSNEVDETTTNCDENNDECPKKKIVNNNNRTCVFVRMRERYLARNCIREQTSSIQPQQKINDINCNIDKVIVRNHIAKHKNAPCSMLRLRRKMQHFLYNHLKQGGDQHKKDESET